MRRVISLGLICFAATAFGSEARLRVVTSFFPIFCWTTNVTGDRAIVENLLPPRAEPHDYAFTPSDARRLIRADLVVVNGLGLENWLPRFLRSSPHSAARVVEAAHGLDSELIYGGHEHHHHHGHGHDDHDHGHAHEREAPNEHIWLDPRLAAHAVSNILASLQRIDPAHSAFYASNALAYIARLHQLDRAIEARLTGITNRAIVTYHDAFAYFAQRYDLEIIGVVEQVPEVNPTPKYLSRLGRTMREDGVRTIFVPPGGQTRLARRIAKDLRVELAELATLESGPLTQSGYEEEMLKNAAALERSLR